MTSENSEKTCTKTDTNTQYTTQQALQHKATMKKQRQIANRNMNYLCSFVENGLEISLDDFNELLETGQIVLAGGFARRMKMTQENRVLNPTDLLAFEKESDMDMFIVEGNSEVVNVLDIIDTGKVAQPANSKSNHNYFTTAINKFQKVFGGKFVDQVESLRKKAKESVDFGFQNPRQAIDIFGSSFSGTSLIDTNDKYTTVELEKVSFGNGSYFDFVTIGNGRNATMTYLNDNYNVISYTSGAYNSQVLDIDGKQYNIQMIFSNSLESVLKKSKYVDLIEKNSGKSISKLNAKEQFVSFFDYNVSRYFINKMDYTIDATDVGHANPHHNSDPYYITTDNSPHGSFRSLSRLVKYANYGFRYDDSIFTSLEEHMNHPVQMENPTIMFKSYNP